MSVMGGNMAGSVVPYGDIIFAPDVEPFNGPSPKRILI